MLLPLRQTKRKLFLGSWSFCVQVCVDSSIVSAQPWYHKWLQSYFSLHMRIQHDREWKLSVLVSNLHARGLRAPTIFNQHWFYYIPIKSTQLVWNTVKTIIKWFWYMHILHVHANQWGFRREKVKKQYLNIVLRMKSNYM